MNQYDHQLYMDIDSAAYYMGEFMETWGFIYVVQTKEKFSTARVYTGQLSNFWQRFIYRLAYKKAIKKWPHITKNIIDGCSYPELLEGLPMPARRK